MSLYHLSHRAILELTGDTVSAFLQDILTADVAGLATGQMRQSCLLSPQGRILIEMTIYQGPKTNLGADGAQEVVWIACDTSQIDELEQKLKLYKLRRNITLTKRPDLCLLAHDEIIDNVILSASDTRTSPSLTHSLIHKDYLSAHEILPLDLYHHWRLVNAIPEGPQDLTPNRALMLEAGLDFFDAVDFNKGCYIGQEVTARTRYRGLVKRRFVPVTARALSSGDTIFADDKEVGTILSAVTCPAQDEDPPYMIGLASMRLSAIHDAEQGAALHTNHNDVRLAIPDHIRPIPDPNKS
ncbi:MAG: YgfZ/GcvT domain-containing protein [Candidatus Puniceispirillaceae bacterium]